MLRDGFKDKNEYEYYLIDNILDSILHMGGEKILSSIILTGSFGRGEPSFSYDEEGYVHLISDIEIACVYKKDKKATERLISSVSSLYSEDLNLMPLSEKRLKNAYNFNGSVIVPKYKTILTYDLFNGSKTIWGKDFLSAKKVGIEECDPYEAKRLVANRIGELVYLLSHSKDKTQVNRIKSQWKGKLILAIASSLLICEKQYVSSYKGQHDIIMNQSEEVKKILGNSFLSDYHNCFVFLRESGEQFEVEDSNLREYVKVINLYFARCGLNSSKVNSFSRKVKYLIKYLKTKKTYGLFNFENNILQMLIDQFEKNEKDIIVTADVWHKVLY